MSESIERFIRRGPGFLAVLRLGSTPLPHLPSVSWSGDKQKELRKRGKLLTGEGGAGWAWSRIIRPQESMALYKSFNSLRSMYCIIIYRDSTLSLPALYSVQYMCSQSIFADAFPCISSTGSAEF